MASLGSLPYDIHFLLLSKAGANDVQSLHSLASTNRSLRTAFLQKQETFYRICLKLLTGSSYEDAITLAKQEILEPPLNYEFRPSPSSLLTSTSHDGKDAGGEILSFDLRILQWALSTHHEITYFARFMDASSKWFHTFPERRNHQLLFSDVPLSAWVSAVYKYATRGLDQSLDKHIEADIELLDFKSEKDMAIKAEVGLFRRMYYLHHFVWNRPWQNQEVLFEGTELSSRDTMRVRDYPGRRMLNKKGKWRMAGDLLGIWEGLWEEWENCWEEWDIVENADTNTYSRLHTWRRMMDRRAQARSLPWWVVEGHEGRGCCKEMMEELGLIKGQRRLDRNYE